MKIQILNWLVIIKIAEFIGIFLTPPKEISRARWFTGEFYQTFT